MRHHRQPHSRQPRQHADAGAIIALLSKTQLITAAECDAKRAELDAVLAAILHGRATDAMMDTLIDAINIAGERTRGDNFPEAAWPILAAKGAMESIWDRHARTGKWGASAAEHHTLTIALDYIIGIMGASTHQEMRQASAAITTEYRRMERTRGRAAA